MTQVLDAVRDNPAVAEQIAEQYQALLSRSATDVEFRTQLLTNPRAAMAVFAGKSISEIPESVNIKFIENTADATIVLPDFVDATAELSDRDLEMVAGGTSDPVVSLLTVVVASLGAALSYVLAKTR